ncbi:hypothetical protein [Nocardioides pocheonensis]|uniref:Uncharacterized protein n=1 Tax=Nocardioides pocheonensis TaxID=661485 RepID=A0A3N0GGR8_9ACTN|nr:hypothetical protein [Nocardioides pocheonensis]RNM11655.1 hypothetical protein EFL26_21045 [Nocardioides pocheonensis]
MGKKVLLPKTECCVSTTRCDRCPIRMLKDGTLPAGYGVRKRQLVRLDADGKKARKIKKSDLVAALRVGKNKKGHKKSGKKKLAA